MQDNVHSLRFQLRDLLIAGLIVTIVGVGAAGHCGSLFGADHPAKGTPQPQFVFVRKEEARAKPAATLKGSPDGKIRLSVQRDKARMIDTTTEKTIGKELEAGKVHDLVVPVSFTCWSFSPDGKLLVTGSGYFERVHDGNSNNVGRVQLWDTATGKLLAKVETGNVRSVAFSEDGNIVMYDASHREVEAP